MTLTYVVSELTVDQSDDPTMATAAGFNLDGLYSTMTEPAGCLHADFVSALDPDQNSPSSCRAVGVGCLGGVDNQLPSLVNALDATIPIRQLLASQVRSNRVAFIARITDVDSLLDDDRVIVGLYNALPAFSSDCDRVLPDREYSVRDTTLIDGDLERPRFRAEGSIVAGRLRIGAAVTNVITLPLPVVGGPAFELTIRNAQFRFDVTATAAERGNLGGYLVASELVTAACAAFPRFCTVNEAVIGGAVDVQNNGVCYDRMATPPRFGFVGFGLGGRAVRARISTAMPVVAAPAPGTCGAVPPIAEDAGARD